jgi:hypothetical protein
MTTDVAPASSAIWGIGWYSSADGNVAPYLATHLEMSRHRATALERLAALGIVRDDIVVYVASNREAVQFLPWEEAANSLGAAFCVVDGSHFDAHRLIAYVRLLRLERSSD